MRKLAKYLKPFRLGLILALILLFGQALGELSLPNLMSDIVNIGLQQGGIQHAAPELISVKGLDLITAYMPEDTRQFVGQHYINYVTRLSNGFIDETEYNDISKFVYTKEIETFNNEQTLQIQTQLDEAFSLAAYTFMQRLGATASHSWEATAEIMDGFDMEMLYNAHDIMERSAAVFGEPPPSPTPINNSVGSNSQNPASPPDFIPVPAETKQTGILFARAFYKEVGIDTAGMQNRYILKTGMQMLLLALLAGIATVIVGYLAPRIAAGAAKDLRRDLFAKVEMFSHHEFDKLSSASLITRCTNDVSQVQMFVGMGIRMLCVAPIMCVGGIIMAVHKSVSMSWIIALTVILLIGTASVVVVIAMPKFKAIQQMIDRLNKISREILSGLMVVRAFSTQEHEIRRFDMANQDLTDINLFVARVVAVIEPVMTFIMSGASLLIIWVGAKHIAASNLQIGDMLAFMQYAMQVIISFMLISMMLFIVPRAIVSAERIAEVLDMPLSITDPEISQPFDPSKSGIVTFSDVYFRHHNAEEDALSGISFTAQPGQTTAIIGPTGSGKSTLASLLLRFYDVSRGSITVSGTDIRQVTQADLRARIGYVPQKGQLFTGSIADNIRYGKPDATESEVEEAAAMAQAMDFINEKENGTEAEISQGGANVSGGQKQRLSIARALAKKPEILVFDDSFSALDFQTDRALRKALREHTATATLIVIAQRVGTIINAEQIIVLDQGKIAGRGTHDELLQSCPAYAEIASSQMEGTQNG